MFLPTISYHSMCSFRFLARLPFSFSDPAKRVRSSIFPAPSPFRALVSTLPPVVFARTLLTPGLQQRNGRKTLTTVQGLPDKYDPKKLLKAMKKEFACNGTVVSSADSDDEEAADKPKANDFGKVLQFQGDQRMKVKEFLVVSGLVPEKEAKDTIVV